MVCKNCGKEILNTSAEFCPYCGTKLDVETVPNLAAIDVTKAEAIPDTQTASSSISATPALVWGIVASCICWIPIAGTIVSIIALGKANNYIKSGAPKSAKAIVGKVLSIISLVASIIFILYWIFVVIVAVNY